MNPYKALIRRCQTLIAMENRLEKLQLSITPDLSADTRRRRFASIATAQEKLILEKHELFLELVQAMIVNDDTSRYGMKPVRTVFGIVSLYFRKPGDYGPAPKEPTPLEKAIDIVTNGHDEVAGEAINQVVLVLTPEDSTIPPTEPEKPKRQRKAKAMENDDDDDIPAMKAKDLETM